MFGLWESKEETRAGARQLDFTWLHSDLDILTVKDGDGAVKACRLMWGDNKWANELYDVNYKTGKLFVRKGRKAEADNA
ncbi:hypothetical protein AK812_SmicGene20322 [Symbiodinium microadriaticum]|uniref:Uncharacterized protein n=1 Tax=Symbiodinium microadriaticum TaxID=2951 RepID=A0A1Q9DQA8_SYMMI|nr:hypothetical protein AK812_SmicGene20322 [Symbiodinium microadriaticum]